MDKNITLDSKYNILVRVTALVINDRKLLIVKQKVDERNWSLPGGKLERGEALDAALVREVFEETGLEITVDRLAYVAEKPADRLIHITFICTWTGGEIRLPSNEHDENPISDVCFADISRLEDYGFSSRFLLLAEQGFPVTGLYVGEKVNIGL